MNSLPTWARSASGSASQVSETLPGPRRVDEVDLSTTMCLLVRALSGTDVRTERIATLRQSIAASSYNVPSSHIAGKLINSLLKNRT